MSDFADAAWRKSTRSTGQNDNCVEVAVAGGAIGFRDGKDPGGPVLVFGGLEVAALLTGVKSGRLDR